MGVGQIFEEGQFEGGMDCEPAWGSHKSGPALFATFSSCILSKCQRSSVLWGQAVFMKVQPSPAEGEGSNFPQQDKQGWENDRLRKFTNNSLFQPHLKRSALCAKSMCSLQFLLGGNCTCGRAGAMSRVSLSGAAVANFGLCQPPPARRSFAREWKIFTT